MKLRYLVTVLLLPVFLMGTNECESPDAKPTSDSGVHKASVKVQTGSDGLTIEQRNIADRLKEDNKPGAIKHLYIISPYSGQVLLYSPVRGKVTSGGKRLTPVTVAALDGASVGYGHTGVEVEIGGRHHYTAEVLQDDGTYGHSGEYLYWWDVKGIYHQHYLTGGQIVHVASAPIQVKDVVINLETAQRTDNPHETKK